MDESDALSLLTSGEAGVGPIGGVVDGLGSGDGNGASAADDSPVGREDRGVRSGVEIAGAQLVENDVAALRDVGVEEPVQVPEHMLPQTVGRGDPGAWLVLLDDPVEEFNDFFSFLNET